MLQWPLYERVAVEWILLPGEVSFFSFSFLKVISLWHPLGLCSFRICMVSSLSENRPAEWMERLNWSQNVDTIQMSFEKMLISILRSLIQVVRHNSCRLIGDISIDPNSVFALDPPPPNTPRIYSASDTHSGNRGSTVVKVLCYKSEGRWFDPSWCQWIFRWRKILRIALSL